MIADKEGGQRASPANGAPRSAGVPAAAGDIDA